MTVAQGTPMTDLFESEWDHYNFPMEALAFARELEREVAALSAQVVELQRMKPVFDAAMDWSGAEPSTSVLCRAIDAAKDARGS